MSNSAPHLSKNRFFEVLQARLSYYSDAIQGEKKGHLDRAMRMAAHYVLENIKRLDAVHDFFGSGLWGYGINRLCDGTDEWNQPDFQEIAQMPGRNKHHEAYRILMMMIFKIVNDKIVLTVLAIDPCQGSVNCDQTKEYLLQDLGNVSLRIRPPATYISLTFANTQKPVSFQIETLHPGGYWLSGSQLAQYYKEEIEKRAEAVRKTLSTTPAHRSNFLADLIFGVRLLYDEGDSAAAIKSHRDTNAKNEGAFRDYFCTYFRSIKYQAEPESKKGSKRIDLKVIAPVTNEKKIIEFKGWWNPDKNEIIQQLCGYLSEFEKDGYVFMVNHTKTSIKNKYQQIIQSQEMKFIGNSWETITIEGTGFEYYRSLHNYGEQGKTLHHIIFNLFSLTTGE